MRRIAHRQRHPVFAQLHLCGVVARRGEEGLLDAAQIAVTALMREAGRPGEFRKTAARPPVGHAVAARMVGQITTGERRPERPVALAVPNLVNRRRVRVAERLAGVAVAGPIATGHDLAGEVDDHLLPRIGAAIFSAEGCQCDPFPTWKLLGILYTNQ